MPTYNDIYIRDNFGDSGVTPSTGGVTQSPDIIPYQSGVLTWNQISSTYAAGPDLGKQVVNQGVNNIYLRGKSLLPSGSDSGTAKLYYALSSLLLLPSRWIPVSLPSGAASAPLVDQNGNTSIAAGVLCVTSPAFVLTNITAPNLHYCFIGIINSSLNPTTVPASFASNAAFAQWVQDTPTVGWRNMSIIPNQQTQMIRNLNFGSDDLAPGNFYFRIVGRNFPAGTTIAAQCSDVGCPINWSGPLPAANPQGNQLTGFEIDGIPAKFTATLLFTATSPGGPFPVGASLSLGYYQVPNNSIALHRKVKRRVQVVRATTNRVQKATNAFLIPLGECNFVVKNT